MFQYFRTDGKNPTPKCVLYLWLTKMPFLLNYNYL
uniref:Uncharacterized protein n=1 Tax=Anguilla anguilla TaxID=7936 RepID=A0A0E9WJK0_ANGAN